MTSGDDDDIPTRPTAVEVLTSDKTINSVLDAYAERASIEHIAMRTGLSRDQVRDVLEDKDLVQKALRRRTTQFALWWAGASFDVIREIFDEGSAQQKLQAVRYAGELLEKFDLSDLPDKKEAPKRLTGLLDRIEEDK